MKEEATAGFLGFESPLDFLSSLFGIKNALINGVIAMIAGIASFTSTYIWDDVTAVYTLWALMAADWITGIAKGVYTKRFVSYKIWRMPIYFVATSFVLSISWWMSKGNLVFSLLPGLVIGGFYSVYFISMLENLGELNLLPKTLVKLLKNRFGLKALFRAEEKKEEQEAQNTPEI